ncbi:MAG: HAD-IA family hydrolase [Bacteroidia bacterium]|nr:HAD-IA family hydrolase [Bacteroidia bacterium]
MIYSAKTIKMIIGVLFDMDGVLLDSEEFMCEAAIRMFAEKGLLVRKVDFLPFIGTGENRYLGGVAEKYGCDFNLDEDKARAYEIYAEITTGKLSPLPGVHKFVKRCKSRSLKLAVATSTDRVKMEINLAALSLPDGTFDQTVNGLEVERKKPFPDIYLEAASRLGVKPEECLVVEDAVSGIEAAKAAGCRCLALMTSFPAERLVNADWICHTLEDAPDESIDW